MVTDHEKTKKVSNIFFKEVENFRITGNDIKAAKKFLKSSKLLDLETNQSIAEYYSFTELFGIKRNFERMIDRVKLKDVKRVFENFFSKEKLIKVVIE